MSNQLQKIVAESGLEKTKSQFILEQFQGFFNVAAEWEKKAKAIVVTDESQAADMQRARAGRLELREKRIAIEKTRKELKEQSWREGKCIDGIANVLKSLIVPLETHLEQQEKFVEFKQKALEEAHRQKVEARMAEEKKAEEEAERKEQERIRLENEKLKEEARAQERIHQEQQAKATAAAAAEREKLQKKAAAAKKRADEKLRKEREKAAAEQKRRDDEARVERERLEAEKKAAEEAKRAAMSNYDKLLAFVRKVAAYDFTCGRCESSGSDLDGEAVDLLQEIGEDE